MKKLITITAERGINARQGLQAITNRQSKTQGCVYIEAMVGLDTGRNYRS